MIRERDTLRRELESAAEVTRERDTLRRELESAIEVVRERDTLRRELESATGLIRERDALRRELEAAQDAFRRALRDELQAAHEAHEQRDAARAMHLMPQLMAIDDDDGIETVVDLTTDTRDEEMQRIENRIRSLELALRDAETRAESAELELELQRRKARAPDETPSPEASEGAEPQEPAFRGPARGAKRVAISSQVDIQIDGTEGRLIDLSMTGAQVLTPFSMKPNRLVKVTLPTDEGMIACKAKVMWSRLEPKAGQLWYRAGVLFTSADQYALEAFLSIHRKDA